MARVHGKDLSTLTIDSVDLRALTTQITWADGTETHDTTTLGDDAREFTAGLTGGQDVSWELLYENTNTTGPWSKLTTLMQAGTSSTLVISDGTRTISATVLVTAVSLPIPVGDMMKISATLKVTGTVTYS